MDEPQTVAQVVTALGGTRGVMGLLGCSPQSVTNWKGRGWFPSHHYVVMARALADRGLSAPLSLWGMTEPEKVSS